MSDTSEVLETLMCDVRNILEERCEQLVSELLEKRESVHAIVGRFEGAVKDDLEEFLEMHLA